MFARPSWTRWLGLKVNKLMAKKQQIEVQWDAPEAFKLAIRQTIDGERITAEQLRVIQDAAESDKLQTQITV
jgi:hypothetical protein